MGKSISGHSEFDEVCIIDDFLKEYKRGIFYCVGKAKRPYPDYGSWCCDRKKCYRQWFEITQIPPLDGKDLQNNANQEKFCKSLKQKLQKGLQGTRYGQINVTLFFNSFPKRNEYEKSLESIGIAILKELPKGRANFQGAQIGATFLDMILIDHYGRWSAMPGINVRSNTAYIDPIYLGERVKKYVEEKEGKSYRSVINDESLWLVIAIRDHASTFEDFADIKHKSEYFDRIYLRGNYQNGHYPIVRIDK